MMKIRLVAALRSALLKISISASSKPVERSTGGMAGSRILAMTLFGTSSLSLCAGQAELKAEVQKESEAGQCGDAWMIDMSPLDSFARSIAA